MNENEGLIDINLFSGVNQRVDSKMLPRGSMSVVENGRFVKEGEVERTPASEVAISEYDIPSINPSTFPGVNDIKRFDNIFTYGSDLYAEGFFENPLDLFGPTANPFSRSYGRISGGVLSKDDKSFAYACGVEKEPLGPGLERFGATGFLSGHTAIVSGNEYQIRDSNNSVVASGKFPFTGIGTARVIATEGTTPRLVLLAGTESTTTLYYVSFTPSTALLQEGSRTVSAGGQWDACHRPGTDFIDFFQVGLIGPTSVFHTCYSSLMVVTLAAGALPTIVAEGFTGDGYVTCNVHPFATSGGDSYTLLTYLDDTTSHPYWALTLNTSSGTTRPTLSRGPSEIVASDFVKYYGCPVGLSDTGPSNVFFAGNDTISASPPFIGGNGIFKGLTNFLPSDGVAPAMGGLTVIGKPFQYEGYPVIPCSGESFHLVAYSRVTTNLDGNFSDLKSIGVCSMRKIAPNNDIGNMMLDDSQRLLVSLSEQTRIVGQTQGFGIVDSTEEGRQFVKFRLSGRSKVRSQFQDLQIVSGAVPAVFDGQYRPLAGAIEAPRAPVLASSSSSGNLTNSGVYSYVTVYEVIDSGSRIWESQPSLPTTITLGASDDTVTVSLFHSAYTSFPNDVLKPVFVRLRVYRTSAGGSIFYDTGITSDLDSGASPTIAEDINDFSSDSEVESQRVLYSTSSSENVCPPPASSVTFGNGRMWLASSDDSGVVYVSKPYVFGEGINFAEELRWSIPGLSEITALHEMDGQIILMSPDRVFIAPAQAPNAAGQGVFPTPRKIAEGVGCLRPGVSVRYSNGILFASSRGIYKVGRDMQVTPVGLQVEDFSTGDWEVTKAIDRTDTFEVWFSVVNSTLGEFRFLVYNHLYDRWSYTGFDSLVHLPTVEDLVENPINKSELLGICNNSAQDLSILLREVVSSGGDSGTTPEPMIVETPWISFAQSRNALSRIKRLFLFGDWLGDCTVTIKIYKDWSTTASQTITDNPTASGGYTAGDAYRMRAHISDQKAEALKFRVEIQPSGATDGIHPSTLGLRYLGKRTGYKLPNSLSL